MQAHIAQVVSGVCLRHCAFAEEEEEDGATAAEVLAQVAHLLNGGWSAFLEAFLNRRVEVGMRDRRQLRFFKAFFGAFGAGKMCDADLSR
jgi:hypothetical protein